MARKYVNMKAGKLKHTANHIRESMGTEEELRELGRSYLKHPWNPIICLADLKAPALPEVFEVAEGNRRLAGVLLEGGPEAVVPVCLTDELVDKSVKLEIMMESAIHTRGLSPYEEYLGASQWMKQNPGATAEQLGVRIGRKPAMMSRIFSLDRCIPAVKEAAAAGWIGVTEWNEFSKCSEQQQAELLAARLSGQVKSRDELAQAARKSRNGSAPAVRVSRVRCILASGVSVVVSGQGVSLEESIDALGQAIKEMKRARDMGYTAKTFAAAMRDRSKKESAS